MANARRSGVGFAMRLDRDQLRRLDALARACGRSREGTVGALLRWASPRDIELVRRLRENTINNIEEADDDARV